MDSKRILVVDDEEVIREFLTEVLGQDYEVTTACDGDEAIASMRTQQFDLVITDLKMPRVSGEEVVKYARTSTPKRPVIVMSGYASLYASSQSAAHGVCAFLGKPFSMKDLIKAVEEALVGWG